jgi:hypothetical protein
VKVVKRCGDVIVVVATVSGSLVTCFDVSPLLLVVSVSVVVTDMVLVVVVTAGWFISVGWFSSSVGGADGDSFGVVLRWWWL